VGTITLTAGTLIVNNVAALGTAAVRWSSMAASRSRDRTTVNAYNTTVGGDVTIISDRFTPPGITQTLAR